MAIKVITPPVIEPMSIEEAKLHLRVDGFTDDVVIASLIRQSREWCEGYQNRKYITQTLELVLDSFPDTNYIELKNCSPIQSVESFKYYDDSGLEHIFDSSNYIVDNDSFVNRITLGHYKSWPGVQLQPVNSVRIRFTAGYGDTSDKVPETIKWAMVLHMKILYDDYRPDERSKLEEARNALLSMNRVIPV